MHHSHKSLTLIAILRPREPEKSAHFPLKHRGGETYTKKNIFIVEKNCCLNCENFTLFKQQIKNIIVVNYKEWYYILQSKPCKMFAATLQPSWPSRPQTKGTLLFYFLKLYNFVFYEIFVGSTSSEVQHPWISKITTEPKKSRKNRFSGSILKCF